MKEVGEQLESWAHSLSDTKVKDLFARSAFNRYYYATFLITRKMLGEFDSDWKHTPHKEIPNLLEKALKKPVIDQLKKDVRKDIITEGNAKKLRQDLQSATTDLANLMRDAYDVRLTADYEPEVPILVENKVIYLKSSKLNSASGWADKANNYCKIIRRVWKDAGLG